MGKFYLDQDNGNSHESRLKELEKIVAVFMQEVQELESYVQNKVQKIRHAEAEIQKIKEGLRNATLEVREKHEKLQARELQDRKNQEIQSKSPSDFLVVNQPGAATLRSWRKQERPRIIEHLADKLAILKKPILLPKISIPKPEFHFPKIHLPKFHAPKFSLPKIHSPRIRLPQIHLPKIHFPQIRFPKFHLPKISLQPLWIGLRHFTRVAVFSFLLFTIGFFVMNANAYSQITMAWLTQFSGTPTESPLTELVAQEQAPVQELFPVSNNKEDQKLQIPDLDLSVTPPDNRLIIPKLNKNIPILDTDPAKLANADIKTLEDSFQEDLKNGVIHFPGTANPGENGNVFITGHSSYYLWDDGDYKDVFARLNKLEVGDDIVVYYNQQKYTYKVREKREVKKDDVSILEQNKDEKIITLMTCTPVGTNLRRLVVVAEQQTTHEAIAE